MANIKTGALPQTLPESTRLKITYRKTGDLIPYAGNARTHSEKQIAQIAAAVAELDFGGVHPLNHVIVGDDVAFFRIDNHAGALAFGPSATRADVDDARPHRLGEGAVTVRYLIEL